MCAIHIPLLIFFNDGFFSLKGRMFSLKNHILSIKPNVIYCFNSITCGISYYFSTQKMLKACTPN